MLYQIVAEKNIKNTASKVKSNLFKHNIVHVLDSESVLPNEDYWLELSTHIGSLAPMEEDASGRKTGRSFTDIKYPWHENSPSFSHSNTRQPLHTDGSYEAHAPQITFFSCMESPQIGGATIFVEIDNLLSMVESYDSSLLNSLREEVVTHRKADDFKTKPIICENLLTWNYYRCEDCDIKHRFQSFLEDYVVGSGSYESVKLAPRQALFFMDEKLLHGRMSFIGNRWLLKGGICV